MEDDEATNRIPDRIWVERGGKMISVMIEPHHPRFSMTLDQEIKRRLNQEGRFELCEKLVDYVNEALAHWADEPVPVYVPRFDMHVLLSDNPAKAGKMLVRLAR